MFRRESRRAGNRLKPVDPCVYLYGKELLGALMNYNFSLKKPFFQLKRLISVNGLASRAAEITSL